MIARGKIYVNGSMLSEILGLKEDQQLTIIGAKLSDLDNSIEVIVASRDEIKGLTSVRPNIRRTALTKMENGD